MAFNQLESDEPNSSRLDLITADYKRIHLPNILLTFVPLDPFRHRTAQKISIYLRGPTPHCIWHWGGNTTKTTTQESSVCRSNALDYARQSKSMTWSSRLINIEVKISSSRKTSRDLHFAGGFWSTYHEGCTEPFTREINQQSSSSNLS